MQIVCASCDEPTPDDAIVCPRCEARVAAEMPHPTVRSQRSDIRAGKAAIVMTFIFGIGFPGFAMLVGLYGLYRLSRVSSDVPGVGRWRWFGVFGVVILALFWGMLRRALSAA
jgi:hypothetical protein